MLFLCLCYEMRLLWFGAVLKLITCQWPRCSLSLSLLTCETGASEHMLYMYNIHTYKVHGRCVPRAALSMKLSCITVHVPGFYKGWYAVISSCCHKLIKIQDFCLIRGPEGKSICHKTNDLSSILGSHMVGGEKSLSSALHTPTMACLPITCPYMHTK